MATSVSTTCSKRRRGSSLESSIAKALRRSRLLTVIVEPGVTDASDWVAFEVKSFEKKVDRTVSINVSGFLETMEDGVEPFARLKKLAWLNESAEALAVGRPSAMVIAGLQTSHRRIKVLTLLKAGCVAVVLLLSALAMLGVLSGQRAARGKSIAAFRRDAHDAIGGNYEPRARVERAGQAFRRARDIGLPEIEEEGAAALRDVAFAVGGRTLFAGGRVPRSQPDGDAAGVARGEVLGTHLRPEGRWLLVGVLALGGTTSSRRIRIWDLADESGSFAFREIDTELRDEPGGGHWLAVALNDVLVWDLRRSSPFSQVPLRLPFLPARGRVSTLLFDPQGRWLLAGAHVAQLWDLHASEPAASSRTLPERSMDGDHLEAAFTRGGGWLVTVGSALRTIGTAWPLSAQALEAFQQSYLSQATPSTSR
jgi:hypothetical protein